MGKVVAWTGPDGIAAVTYPNIHHTTAEEVRDTVVPEAVDDAVILEREEIPNEHREFRTAWRLVAGQVAVDMPLAREVQKDRWRERRKPLLEHLDRESLRAIEGDDTLRRDEVAGKKQQLRDVTQVPLAAVDTPEKLKNTWPSIFDDPEFVDDEERRGIPRR